MRFDGCNCSLSPICPSQTNTDDCGVYMLDMLEKVVLDPPVVNNQFLEKKGNRWHPFTLKSISECEQEAFRDKSYDLQNNRKKK